MPHGLCAAFWLSFMLENILIFSNRCAIGFCYHYIVATIYYPSLILLLLTNTDAVQFLLTGDEFMRVRGLQLPLLL